MIPERDVQRLLSRAQEAAGDLRDLVMTISATPAPTGHEAARSEVLEKLWREHGLGEVVRDELGNVTGVLRGGDGPCVLAEANMDVACPPGSEVAPYDDGTVIRGSGVYDNAAGLAVLLGVAKILGEIGVRLPGEIIFGATVRENSGGNLRGMRTLLERHRNRLTGVLNVGHDLAGLHHEAFGLTTVELRVRGPGGHSYGDLGTPSAIHAIVALLGEIVSLPRPQDPKTSLNVGLIEGGTSGNGIAEQASALIEIRSADAEVLADLEARMRSVVDEAPRPPGIEVDWVDVDRLPHGAIASSHPLVELVAEAHRRVGVGIESRPMTADFNIPLSLGVPAVITGAARGGGIKSANEYLEPASLVTGVQSLVLALVLITNHDWSPIATDHGLSHGDDCAVST